MNKLVALAGLAIAACSIGTAQAADLLIGNADPIYNSPLFRFEGFYVGGTLGLGNFPEGGRVGTVGVVAGNNYELTQSLVAGVEVQGDIAWNDDQLGLNALVLGHFGGYLTDATLVYGALGAGSVDSTASYALGGGIEQAVTDSLSVRGELLGTGGFGGGFDGGKAAIGLLWHMN